MDIRSLPGYRGLPDSPKEWGEPDDEGRLPRMRLRDYLVLALIIMICVPIDLPLLVRLWAYHRNVVIENAIREKQLEEQIVKEQWAPAPFQIIEK
jgi:hypothetical protein